MSVATDAEVREVQQSFDEPDINSRPWGITPQDLIIYLMIAPAVLYYTLFTYVPVPGMMIAFCDYRRSGGFISWVGWENFEFIFTLPRFGQALRNNLVYAGLGYLINFPAPILLAILFNEMRTPRFKKTVQTLTTIPHFISWVVIGGIFKILLDPEYGWVNSVLVYFWGPDASIWFLGDPNVFPFSYVMLSLWKGVGWGTILYLATMASIDHTLFEAASIDGAGRLRQIWHVTLPALKGIILLRLILSFGGILNLFDAMYILGNQSNASVTVVLDTLVYDRAMRQGEFGVSQAMSLFKSLVGVVITVLVNETAKKLSDDGRGIF